MEFVTAVKCFIYLLAAAIIAPTVYAFAQYKLTRLNRALDAKEKAQSVSEFIKDHLGTNREVDQIQPVLEDAIWSAKISKKHNLDVDVAYDPHLVLLLMSRLDVYNPQMVINDPVLNEAFFKDVPEYYQRLIAKTYCKYAEVSVSAIQKLKESGVVKYVK